jgi:hypothetical protein
MADSGSKNEIVTGADRLLELINEQGYISLSQSSRQLGIDKNTIEHWADIFNERGIIKIRFGIGDILLMTPSYFNLTQKKGSMIKEIFNMSLFSPRPTENELEKNFLNKEKELGDRTKALVLNMDKVSALSDCLHKKKIELQAKENRLNKLLAENEKKNRLISEREKQVIMKEAKLRSMLDKGNKMMQKAKILEARTHQEKRNVREREKIVAIRMIEQRNQILRVTRLKEQEVKLNNNLERMKLTKLRANMDLRQRYDNLNKRIDSIKKKELKLKEGKMKLKALKIALSKEVKHISSNSQRTEAAPEKNLHIENTQESIKATQVEGIDIDQSKEKSGIVI